MPTVGRQRGVLNHARSAPRKYRCGWRAPQAELCLSLLQCRHGHGLLHTSKMASPPLADIDADVRQPGILFATRAVPGDSYTKNIHTRVLLVPSLGGIRRATSSRAVIRQK